MAASKSVQLNVVSACKHPQLKQNIRFSILWDNLERLCATFYLKLKFGTASAQCNRTGRTKQKRNGRATIHNCDSWFPNGDHYVVGCFRGDHPTPTRYASA